MSEPPRLEHLILPLSVSKVPFPASRDRQLTGDRVLGKQAKKDRSRKTSGSEHSIHRNYSSDAFTATSSTPVVEGASAERTAVKTNPFTASHTP
jgi:hypothetical protein